MSGEPYIATASVTLKLTVVAAMSESLTQRQRLVVATLYLTLLWAIYKWIILSIPNATGHALFWLYSGALMVILGRYVVEPFFTKPADAIVNALALLVSLNAVSASDRLNLVGFAALQDYAAIILCLGIIAIATKDSKHPALSAVARCSYVVVEYVGSATVVFSAVYLAASYSFFATTGAIGIYVSILALWICITFFDVVGGIIRAVSRIFESIKNRGGDELGAAIGCENPLLYNVQVDYSKYKGADPKYGDLVAIETKTNVGSIGMVVSRKQLLGKSWLSVYILTGADAQVLRIDLRSKKLIADPQSVFSTKNAVFLLSLDELAPEERKQIEDNPLFAERNSFAGYITKDSNINTVNFIILRDGVRLASWFGPLSAI
jgi:energy-converting hydrogenase Eha subunit E